MERKGITVAGTILLDKLYGIANYPTAGELVQIIDIGQAVGGCVPNVACDIKKIRSDIEVVALGKVGKDQEAEFVKNYLESNGVITDAIIADENERTSFTDVMSVIGGQRTFFTYAGASSDFGYDDINFEATNSKILHLGYFLLLKKIDSGDGIKILKKARELGIETSIDLISDTANRYSTVVPVLPYVDYLIVNETEASGLTGIEPTHENLKKIAEKLRELGVKKKVIIHEPELSVCLSDEGFKALPSFELPKSYIKGTTGAGDAFCSGALIGIHDGLSDMEILELASAAAVTSLSEPDATSGVKSQEEIMKTKDLFERKKIELA